jgi:hypothetical protein
MEPTMSQLLTVFAMSLVLSLGPMFIPIFASIVHAIVHAVKNAGGIGAAVRRLAPGPAA